MHGKVFRDVLGTVLAGVGISLPGLGMRVITEHVDTHKPLSSEHISKMKKQTKLTMRKMDLL